MFGLGIPELIIILVIVVLVFGVGRIGDIGGAVGKAMKGFKKAVHEPDEIDITPKSDETGEKKPR